MNLATAASSDTTRASLTYGPLEEQSTNLVSNCSQRHKERAYIAASRRKDRSVEARFQSALQASKIHESRTGKRLRVTKEVVANEEEYEEEEIQLYSHRATFPNIHAAPFHKSLNVVIDRGCKQRFPSDAEWRTNLVNRLFAAYFPKFNCVEAQVDGNVSNLVGESMLTSRDMSWGDAEEQTTFNKERSHETCQPSHSLYNCQNWAALPSETDSTSTMLSTPNSPVAGVADTTPITKSEQESAFMVDHFLDENIFIEEVLSDRDTTQTGIHPTVVFSVAS